MGWLADGRIGLKIRGSKTIVGTISTLGCTMPGSPLNGLPNGYFLLAHHRGLQRFLLHYSQGSPLNGLRFGVRAEVSIGSEVEGKTATREASVPSGVLKLTNEVTSREIW